IKQLAPPDRRPSSFATWVDWANSFDDPWEWAEIACQEPFTDFDLNPEHRSHLLSKIEAAAGVPASLSILRSLGAEYHLPMLHAADGNELAEALEAILPFVRQERAVALDSKNTLESAIHIKIESQFLFAVYWDEIKRREKLSDEKWAREAARLMSDV